LPESNRLWWGLPRTRAGQYREVLLPELDTIDFLEKIAERVPGMREIRFLGASGSCSGSGYTALL
jgi:hypothetical protein